MAKEVIISEKLSSQNINKTIKYGLYSYWSIKNFHSSGRKQPSCLQFHIITLHMKYCVLPQRWPLEWRVVLKIWLILFHTSRNFTEKEEGWLAPFRAMPKSQSPDCSSFITALSVTRVPYLYSLCTTPFPLHHRWTSRTSVLASESRRADFFRLLYGILTLVWVLLPPADEPPKVVPTLPLFMFSPEYLFPPLVLPVRMSPMPGVEPRMIETFFINQPIPNFGE